MSTKKIGVVLPGGGAKGARQAGALRALDLDGRFEVKAISGTSVGALNAVGYIARGSEWLEDLWLNLKQKQVYKKWKLGKVYGFLFKKGLFNAKPLQKLIEKSVRLADVEKSQIDLSVVSVNLNTGKLDVATNFTEDLLQKVYASAAFPVAFPIAKIGKDSFTDGGVLEQVPLFAMPEGLDAYFVIMNSTLDVQHKEKFSFWLHEYIFRMVELMTTEIKADDTKSNLPNVHFIYPSKQYITNSLDFETNRKEAFFEGFATMKQFLKGFE